MRLPYLPYEDCCTIFVAKHPVTKAEPEGDTEILRRSLQEKIDELMEGALRDNRSA